MEEEKGYIKITEQYLDDSIKYIGSSLVGKIMKRFELSEDKNDIKIQCKELVYEEIRNFKNMLIAFNSGRVTVFNFKTKPKQS